jgi:metallo-beta-lactamase class B
MGRSTSGARLRCVRVFNVVVALLIAGAGVEAICAEIADAAPVECTQCQKWNVPVEPFRIYGNAWYVGPQGLSAVLITSNKGHILIDADLAESAPLIEENIRKLGFRVEDVKYILNSHAHFDHAGGIAALQNTSRATVAALADAADAIERGRGDRGDPQFLSAQSYPPARNVRRINDGDTIRVGDIAITAHATPGHTPGGTSWTWKSCAAGRCLDVVYADSLTAVSDDVYRYTDELSHPGYLVAFRHSIATIATLPCDILLTPHPDAGDFWKRRDAAADGSGLIGGDMCRHYADNAAQGLEQRVAEERKSGHP